MRTTLAICSALLLVGCSGEAPVDENTQDVRFDVAPNGRGNITQAQLQAAGATNFARPVPLEFSLYYDC